MASVTLKDVTKKYGSVAALNGVSFTCNEGEFFTLLGPSGAGKTTTLNIIAGLAKMDSGSVYMGDEDITELPTQERDVAMAFENYALYSHLKVYDNIAFPLRSPKRTEKLSQSAERAEVERIAGRLGIGEYLERMPKQLSGGQKQRVSLARAMVRKPKVFLLDEPIAHLDAKLRALARSDLKRIANEFGTTIIYVTHNYREALALSDRILIMREGKVEQIGTPEEIYYKPVSDFVANLVGDPPINLLDGDIKAEGDELLFIGEGFNFKLSGEQKKAVENASWEQNGRRMVRLAARPEHMSVSTQKISEESAQMTLFATERKDENHLLKFRVSTGQLIVDAGKNPCSTTVDDKLWIGFNLEHTHCFRKTIELQ